MMADANRGIALEVCCQVVARADTVHATCHRASAKPTALRTYVFEDVIES